MSSRRGIKQGVADRTPLLPSLYIVLTDMSTISDPDNDLERTFIPRDPHDASPTPLNVWVGGHNEIGI